ncbi:FhaA domain-containing protein [Tepidiforma sp.]|uniref:FhaA domain-containing protein n=1 Tax=Tepidiforma sp. TaxID=2682230 RepID=UPI002ADDAC87|nr:FhaA domain-containing protein [Tepidiforma sp.]
MSEPSSLERLAARALRLGLPRALHPATLVQQVVDAVLAGARGGEAPNRIVVRLSPADSGRLAAIAEELRDAVTASLEAACRAAGVRPFGPWELTFQPASATPEGDPAVTVDFHDPAAPASTTTTRETIRLRRVRGLRLRLDGGPSVALTHTPFIIGRGPEADLVLADLSVSRRHAEIRLRSDGALEIRDLGSRNGTFLDGTRIAAAVLEIGDRITLGQVTIELEGAE